MVKTLVGFGAILIGGYKLYKDYNGGADTLSMATDVAAIAAGGLLVL